MNSSSRTGKKYREANITAAFGADLSLQGNTCVPNLLLRFYRQMGITDEEMMLIIQIIRLRTEERDYFPPPVVLARFLSADAVEVESLLAGLMEKEIITVTSFYDPFRDDICTGYNLEPLFEKLSEVWARAKVKEIEKTRALLEKRPEAEFPAGGEAAFLFRSFEQEFGRPLSPIEIEQIEKWAEESEHALILEALRRAVLMGKHNFKYIDSILLEWKKNNLRTLQEVARYDEQFHQSKAGRPARVRPAEQGADERKKAVLKTLYLS